MANMFEDIRSFFRLFGVYLQNTDYSTYKTYAYNMNREIKDDFYGLWQIIERGTNELLNSYTTLTDITKIYHVLTLQLDLYATKKEFVSNKQNLHTTYINLFDLVKYFTRFLRIYPNSITERIHKVDYLTNWIKVDYIIGNNLKNRYTCRLKMIYIEDVEDNLDDEFIENQTVTLTEV